jgi:beta-glucosidase
MGWDLTPSSLERLVQVLWDRYHVPIVVTESGIADAEQCASSGKETGFRRTRYLSACLEAISSLAAKGVDIRGYIIWTLLDNFEWAEGFRPRFGLLHNCFETQTRTRRHVPYAMIQSVFRRAMAQHGMGSPNGDAGAATTTTH